MIASKDLRPHQWDILLAEAPFIFVHGGIGTFKTSTCIMRVLDHCRRYGDQEIIILAQTYDQLFKVFLQEWKRLIPASWYEERSSPKRLELKWCNSILWLQYAENPAAKKRIVGQNTTGYYITQTETFKSKDLFDELNQRARLNPTDPAYDPQMFRLRLMDANPGSPMHFSYKMFVDKSDPDYVGTDQVKTIFVPTTPETSIYTAEQIAEYKKTLSRTEYDRRITGRWVSLEGLVFEKFMVDQHVQKFEPDPAWSVGMGIDWGYNNPMAILFIGVDHDGIVHIFDEIYQSGLEIEQAAEKVAARWTNLTYRGAGVDSAQPNDWRSFRKYMQALGRPVPIRRPKKDRKYITGLMRRRFEPLPNDGVRIRIHPRCKNLIRELSTLQWAESPDGRPNKEVPEDKDNHAIDAWGYYEKAYLERV